MSRVCKPVWVEVTGGHGHGHGLKFQTPEKPVPVMWVWRVVARSKMRVQCKKKQRKWWNFEHFTVDLTFGCSKQAQNEDILKLNGFARLNKQWIRILSVILTH